jgi:hypothetical protein
VANPSTYTKNFFAPLWDLEVKELAEVSGKEDETSNFQRSGKERPPPIIITNTINLLKIPSRDQDDLER